MRVKLVGAGLLLLFSFSTVYAGISDVIFGEKDPDVLACGITNCVCRFIIDDPISSHVFWDSCSECLEAPNPVSCTACPSSLVGLTIGCGTYCRFNDRYETGKLLCY